MDCHNANVRFNNIFHYLLSTCVRKFIEFTLSSRYLLRSQSHFYCKSRVYILQVHKRSVTTSKNHIDPLSRQGSALTGSYFHPLFYPPPPAPPPPDILRERIWHNNFLFHSNSQSPGSK